MDEIESIFAMLVMARVMVELNCTVLFVSLVSFVQIFYLSGLFVLELVCSVCLFLELVC